MNLTDARSDETVPLRLLGSDELDAWLASASEGAARWVRASAFTAKPGSVCLVPAPDGALDQALVGRADDAFGLAAAPGSLPPGSYALEPAAPTEDAERLAFGWALASYRYDRFRAREPAPAATLVWPEGIDRPRVEALVRATFLVRDLINAPASDMGPAHLAEAARELADAHDARFEVIEGTSCSTRATPPSTRSGARPLRIALRASSTFAGATRPNPESRSWAKESASTAAASISSPRAT